MITLLGSTGYVGQTFVKYLQERSIPFESLSRHKLDYTHKPTLLQYLKSNKPTFLINSAGYTGKPNVDACELDKANCLLGNAVLPGVIAEACAETNTLWGHVSSGCIYQGSDLHHQGFKEEDVPNFSFRKGFCSFYSGTKALGEEVLKNFPQCYIWRLRIPFDNVHSSRNYISKLITYKKLLQVENSISNLHDFVRAAYQTFELKLPCGIYNITNPGFIVTKRITQLIIEEANRREKAGVFNPFPKEFSFFESEEEFLKTAAKTPRSNCILNTDKLQISGIHLPHVEESLRFCLQNWVHTSNL